MDLSLNELIKLYESLPKEIALFHFYFDSHQQSKLNEIILSESAQTLIGSQFYERKKMKGNQSGMSYSPSAVQEQRLQKEKLLDFEMLMVLLFFALTDQFPNCYESISVLLQQFPADLNRLKRFIIDRILSSISSVHTIKTKQQVHRKSKQILFFSSFHDQDYYYKTILNSMEEIFQFQLSEVCGMVHYVFSPVYEEHAPAALIAVTPSSSLTEDFGVDGQYFSNITEFASTSREIVGLNSIDSRRKTLPPASLTTVNTESVETTKISRSSMSITPKRLSASFRAKMTYSPLDALTQKEKRKRRISEGSLAYRKIDWDTLNESDVKAKTHLESDEATLPQTPALAIPKTTLATCNQIANIDNTNAIDGKAGEVVAMGLVNDEITSGHFSLPSQIEDLALFPDFFDKLDMISNDKFLTTNQVANNTRKGSTPENQAIQRITQRMSRLAAIDPKPHMPREASEKKDLPEAEMRTPVKLLPRRLTRKSMRSTVSTSAQNISCVSATELGGISEGTTEEKESFFGVVKSSPYSSNSETALTISSPTAFNIRAPKTNLEAPNNEKGLTPENQAIQRITRRMSRLASSDPKPHMLKEESEIKDLLQPETGTPINMMPRRSTRKSTIPAAELIGISEGFTEEKESFFGVVPSPPYSSTSTSSGAKEKKNIHQTVASSLLPSSPLSPSAVYCSKILRDGINFENLSDPLHQFHHESITNFYRQSYLDVSKNLVKIKKCNPELNLEEIDVPMVFVDFTKLLTGATSISLTNEDAARPKNQRRSSVGKNVEAGSSTSCFIKKEVLSSIGNSIQIYFQHFEIQPQACSRRFEIEQQLQQLKISQAVVAALEEGKHLGLSITSILQRIQFSMQRILVYLLPSRPSRLLTFSQNPLPPRLIWDNILCIKRFRPASMIPKDQDILSYYYNQFKHFAYAIAESPYDDFTDNCIKRRMMLSIEDSSLAETPILQEIYFAIQSLVGGFPSSINHSSLNEEVPHHLVEGMAFLFSPKYGVEQKPHTDYNYNILDQIDLTKPYPTKASHSQPSSSTNDGTSTNSNLCIPFFHPEMSYSFIYAIYDDTMLHFINSFDDSTITIHLMAGDLLIWSGQQIHYGARYVHSSNIRLFGNIRSKLQPKVENEFYWYDSETKSIQVLPSAAMVPADKTLRNNENLEKNESNGVDVLSVGKAETKNRRRTQIYNKSKRDKIEETEDEDVEDKGEMRSAGFKKQERTTERTHRTRYSLSR